MPSYYAYVRDDERDDHDYTCELCTYFNRGWCELHDKKIDIDDDACEDFE